MIKLQAIFLWSIRRKTFRNPDAWAWKFLKTLHLRLKLINLNILPWNDPYWMKLADISSWTEIKLCFCRVRIWRLSRPVWQALDPPLYKALYNFSKLLKKRNPYATPLVTTNYTKLLKSDVSLFLYINYYDYFISRQLSNLVQELSRGKSNLNK